MADLFSIHRPEMSSRRFFEYVSEARLSIFFFIAYLAKQNARVVYYNSWSYVLRERLNENRRWLDRRSCINFYQRTRLWMGEKKLKSSSNNNKKKLSWVTCFLDYKKGCKIQRIYS